MIGNGWHRPLAPVYQTAADPQTSWVLVNLSVRSLYSLKSGLKSRSNGVAELWNNQCGWNLRRMGARDTGPRSSPAQGQSEFYLS